MIQNKGALQVPEYRIITDFPDYKISNEGTVMRIRTRYGRTCCTFLKLILGSAGYYQVTLRRNGTSKVCYVHRLVLETFIGPCPEGYVARHFPDPTKTNNNLTNLSWASPLRNVLDRKIHNTDNQGLRHGRVKLSESAVKKIRELHTEGDYTQDSLARMFDVSRTVVAKIVNNQTWTHLINAS